MLCILCSLLFCDIVLLCVTVFLCILLFIVLVLYCVCLLCTCCYPNRFLHAFSSVVRQMPGYNSQRRCTARTSQISYFCCCVCLIFYCYVPFSVFCVLFVCKCVLYCCHRVSTQLRLYIYIYMCVCMYRVFQKELYNFESL
jgi:hypothetical protein